MKKRVFMCLLCLLAVTFASPGWAESSLWSCHQTTVYYRIGGEAEGVDFSTAQFLAVSLGVSSDISAVNPETEGTLKISGAPGYSYWTGREQKKNVASSEFKLRPTTKITETPFEDFTGYVPVTEDYTWSEVREAGGAFAYLILNANNGVNGATVTWNAASESGSGKVPNFRTTEEQLKTYVPYIKFTGYPGEERADGFDWRVVSPDHPENPISLGFKVGIRSYAYTVDHSTATGRGETIKEPWTYFDAGTPITGHVNFNSTPGVIVVKVQMITYDDPDNPSLYEWTYYHTNPPDEESKKLDRYIAVDYGIRATMEDGKTSYRYAEFSGLGIEVVALEPMEPKYLTNEGRIHLPAGNYTLFNTETQQETPFTLSAGDTAVPLKMMPMRRLGDTYSEFPLVDDDDWSLVIRDNAEGTSLSGKTISWTFPDNVGYNGEDKVPPYMSLSEQKYLPYIEVVSNDAGLVTAVKFRAIESGDMTATAVDPGCPWRFIAYLRVGTSDLFKQFDNESRMVDDGFYSGVLEGTWTIDDPFPYEELYQVHIDFELRTDLEDNFRTPCAYKWFFVNDSPAGVIGDTEDGIASDVLANIAESVEGISSAGDINTLSFKNIREIPNATPEVKHYVENDHGEVVGRFNKIRVGKNGWYAMKLRLPDELFDTIRGLTSRELKIYPLILNKEGEVQNVPQVQEVREETPRVSLAGTTSTVRLTADTGATAELLAADGTHFDSITGERDFLIAGSLNGTALEEGQTFGIYLGKVQAENPVTPDNPNSPVTPDNPDTPITPNTPSSNKGNGGSGPSVQPQAMNLTDEKKEQIRSVLKENLTNLSLPDGVDPSTVSLFTLGDSSAVDMDSTLRDTDSLNSAEKTAVSADNKMPAAIFPKITIKQAGIYGFVTSLDISVPEDATLEWHPFPQTEANSGNTASVSVRLAADGDGDKTAVFMKNGETITTVPADHEVEVAAYFDTGTYTPVIAAVENNGSPTSSKGSGGCDALSGGLLVLLGLALLRWKR